MNEITLLSALIFLAALLYSSVGHAGASGYLAAMALVGIAPDAMKPSALILNILVATITTIRFYRAGYFSWSVFWPFASSSVPFAFVGGYLTLPNDVFKLVVGMALLLAACVLLLKTHVTSQTTKKPIRLPWALFFGASIGLLSGLTGVGGGIYLSPLLLFLGWAETKESGGVSAAFILVTSVAGIIGHLSNLNNLPSEIPYWAAAAVIGGLIGSHLGSRYFGTAMLRRILAGVLIIAGIKIMAVRGK